jgi:hypothetical protein
MPTLPKQRTIQWTNHAKAKMAFYKLSRQRVLHVLNSPKRIEEGVAPKTLAAMQPASIKTVRAAGVPAKAGTRASQDKFKETWSQEIWVMVEDAKGQRIIISAWRYPGMTKLKSETALEQMRKEYEEYRDS